MGSGHVTISELGWMYLVVIECPLICCWAMDWLVHSPGSHNYLFILSKWTFFDLKLDCEHLHLQIIGLYNCWIYYFMDKKRGHCGTQIRIGSRMGIVVGKCECTVKNAIVSIKLWIDWMASTSRCFQRYFSQEHILGGNGSFNPGIPIDEQLECIAFQKDKWEFPLDKLEFGKREIFRENSGVW